MVRISTFVFFDIETTGLPHQEYNCTKIIEICFVAVTRSDIRRSKGTLPPVSKLSFLFNPNQPIHSTKITGLSNDFLKYAPIFKERVNTIDAFLENLSKPVCLVAHNGNVFDYKILLAEYKDANVTLPDDLLCVDSLPGFRRLLKNKPALEEPQPLMTDDEDEWPNLNITPEDYEEIDRLCFSFSDMSCERTNNKAKVTNAQKKKRENYKLTEIYKRLFAREPENAHRAESDCIMLMQCVGLCQNANDTDQDFLRWMDGNCKKLNEITPLKRK